MQDILQRLLFSKTVLRRLRQVGLLGYFLCLNVAFSLAADCSGVAEYQTYPSIYMTGDKVVYNGNLYECLTDNLYNVTPGTADHWWSPLGACDGGGGENVDPTVSFVSPQDNALIEQEALSAVAIEVAAADADGTVDAVSITVDGQSFSGTTASWTPSAYGTFAITSTVTDNEGATGTASVSVTISQTVDTPPVVAFVSPSADLTVTQETFEEITVSISATDDGTVTSSQIDIAGTVTSGTTASFTPTAYGDYVVTASATDDANQTTIVSITITVAEPSASTCSYASWSASTTYVGNDIVEYNGLTYKAAWAPAVGAEPTVDDVWKLEGSCGALDCTQYPEWKASVTYQENGMLVTYNDKVYKLLNYWSVGQVPSDTPASWQEFADCGGTGGGTGGQDAEPSVSFTSPTTTTFVMPTFSSIAIAVSATDHNGVVSDVTLAVGGQTFASSTASWTPSAYGTFTITATATNEIGSTVETFDVTIVAESGGSDINADGSIVLTGPFAPTPNTSNQRIVGYIPTWRDTETLDFSKVTHVNVAFLLFDQKEGAAYSDSDFSSGAFHPVHYATLDSMLPGIVERAHNQGATVSIALGGATDFAFLWLMEHYQDNPAMIETIANQVVDYVNLYNLDGVDLDLECWWQDASIAGTSEQGGRTRGQDAWGGDVDQGAHPAGYGMTLLAKKLRAKMPNKLLSAAVFATPWYANNYDADAAEYLDWVGIMSYDFTGSWDTSPKGPHSALYEVNNSLYQGASDSNPIYSIETAMRYWSGDWSTWQGSGQQVSKDKLVIGVPFYGYDLNTKKSQAGQSGNGYHFITYAEILADYPNADTSYDPNDPNNQGGLVSEDGKLIFFDTPKMVKAKVEYAKAQGTQGTMIWELTYDTADPAKSLLVAMNEANSNARIAGVPLLEQSAIETVFYPNPFKQQISLQFNLKKNGNIAVQVYNLQGKVVKEIIETREKGSQVLELDASDLPEGIYLIKAKTDQFSITKKMLKGRQ
ncbi:glycosyl hydrolase family 18 protein [Limibacter armeniacum]|uniref:glycosyl hydrolase family 18 protein n=1 Tax=Limibacter armeniacum TaxID=466084 RepID=UPI002FE6B1E7